VLSRASGAGAGGRRLGAGARAGLAGAALAAAVSVPHWLPRAVVAARMRVFARINGDEGVTFPNATVGPDRFLDVYGHPAASGRSRGAALSDLFWYWLAPGPEVHQEHLEPGPRYDAAARTTAAVLAGRSADLAAAATRATARVLDEKVNGRATLVRLRDLMMPVWAEFFHELVFREPCPREVRDLITGNATDVVDALKCVRLRHMRRRRRLTRHLLRRLAAGEVPHELPAGMSRLEHAHYLQGTFFNTAVVQLSEGMAHLLLALAEHPGTQRRLTEHPGDDRLLGNVMDEVLRRWPLFGIAHRIARDDIDLGDGTLLPAGSVLCFSYPDYHATGCPDPEAFRPDRWDAPGARATAHHIPFGVATNRPCPAWRLSPLVMRAATREVLRRHTLHSAVSHTRSIPHRAPCLLVRRDQPLPALRLAAVRAFLRFRDRWEDVGRSLAQLVLGTWMVLDARRLRLAERHFAAQDAQDAQEAQDAREAQGGPDLPRAPGGDPGPGAGPAARCPYPHG
jgi:hypothetical protein